MTARRTSRKAKNPSEAAGRSPLFGDTGTNQVAILSSSFAIGPLLARGALLAEAMDDGDPLLRPLRPLKLVSTAGRVPAAWVNRLVSAARNVIPIVVALLPEASIKRFHLPDVSEPIEGVGLSRVRALVFRNETERTRFTSQQFANYDLAATNLPLEVDAALFEGQESADAPAVFAEAVDREADLALSAARAAARSADCRAGLLAFLLSGSPGRKAWMDGVARALQKPRKLAALATWPDHVARMVLGLPVALPPVDTALLAAAIGVLERHPVEHGWSGDRALEEITTAAQGHEAVKEERFQKEIGRWKARAADVLAARSEPQSLADDAFVLQRALLLLLLRGDVDAIEDGAKSVPRPGWDVFGVASALASYRAGLRALPARFKIEPHDGRSRRLLSFLGDVFLATLSVSADRLVPSGIEAPVVKYRSAGALRGEWSITLGPEEIATRPSQHDPGLQRILAMARHLGYDFDEFGDDGLVTDVPQDGGGKQSIRLTLLPGNGPGGTVVRFTAPILKLVAKRSRSKLPREFLLDLLARNAKPEVNCRFAIDEGAQEIVLLVDQSLSTMDDAEFAGHIGHVARVAADFELSHGVGTLTPGAKSH